MSNARSRIATLVLILSLVGLAGCSDDDHSPLVGVDWVLRSATVEGLEVYPKIASPEVVVRFSTTTYEVDNGCTTSGGSYELVTDVVVPSDQWGQPNICTIIHYQPSHFLQPFVHEIRGRVLTATLDDTIHVYDAR